jgi:hypothetical protein
MLRLEMGFMMASVASSFNLAHPILGDDPMGLVIKTSRVGMTWHNASVQYY